MVSYLRLVANPTDELAWHRVLLLLPGIGTRTVERFLGQISTYHGLPEILEKVIAPHGTGGKHSRVLSSLRALLESISRETMPPAEQLQQAINHYGPIMEAKYKKDPSRRKRAADAPADGTEVRLPQGVSC